MRTLVVSPYAPTRDGIANYSVQEVKRLRAEGQQVDVLSPLPSAAQLHADVSRPSGMARLLRIAGGYDRVIVHLFPALVTARCRSAGQRTVNWWLLAAVGRRTALELRIHEIDYGVGRSNTSEASAIRAALRAASRITVHTESEREDLRSVFGVSDVTLVEHGASFVPRSSSSKAEARAELGLPLDEMVYLSIGFLQTHKGFDRAIRAFGKAGIDRARLCVVGSVRVDVPELLEYAALLERLAAQTPGVDFQRRYVGDAEFDRWLAAADVLVLPYREIWSSSVIERAKLFGLTMIATDVGGLAHQVDEKSLVVRSDSELVAAMREVADPDRRLPPLAEEWELDEDAPDPRRIEAQIVARARRSSPATDESRGAAISALGNVPTANASSSRPGVPFAKQLIMRLTMWQLEPLVSHLNRLQAATAKAIDQLDAELPDTEGRGDE